MKKECEFSRAVTVHAGKILLEGGYMLKKSTVQF
jgi:hypothetical protein